MLVSIMAEILQATFVAPDRTTYTSPGLVPVAKFVPAMVILAKLYPDAGVTDVIVGVEMTYMRVHEDGEVSGIPPFVTVTDRASDGTDWYSAGMAQTIRLVD